MRRRRAHRLVSAAAATLVLAAASPAHAHAVIAEMSVDAGTVSAVTIRIAHGCGTSPTVSVEVSIPEGVLRVFPRHSTDWLVETHVRALDEPAQPPSGPPVTELVERVTWSGGSLPDGLFEEFQLLVQVPDEPGRMLRFKTKQVCDDGEIDWAEIPESEDQNPYELDQPAPFVRIAARADDAGHH